MASNKPNKLVFLSMPAPASYVAGLGRGASGFTTRSDIGPAREGPSAEVIAEAQARRGEEPDVDPSQFQDPDNEYGLFAGTTYEQDDEEADKVYEQVDEAMDSRRRARREVAEKDQMQKLRAERPKIQQQFADLKRGLSVVTDEEWENLPEVGNLTRKKRKREERSFVIPDSVIVGDRSRIGYDNALDLRQQQAGGFETPVDAGALTNLVEIGQARDKILSLKLDQMSGISSTSGTTTSVDPKGYLTSLDNVIIKSDAEIGDIKRARILFDSLVKSNPKHAPGWIAAACLEEHAGKMVSARKIIKQGCEMCPKSEDVWIEAARLHNSEDAKVILANAVQHVGQSVNIWLKAADLEHDVKAKKRVLRKALEHIPNSFDARIILSRAVEVIPHSVELWLALARLETPDKAKAVLNKARKSVPTSHEIWIAASRLLEQEASSPPKTPEQRSHELDLVDKTIEAGVRELRKHQVMLTREEWLKEAEKCESEGSPRTCEALVKATVAMQIEEEDRLDTWVGDAESAESRGMVGTARACWPMHSKSTPTEVVCGVVPPNWRKPMGLEKEKWLAGDVPAARQVLEQAFVANPESEQIWLAAVKLEAENGEFAVARELLIRARTVADTERIWMKSAVFERQQDQLSAALETLETALKKFPKFAKLYMIQGQIHQSMGNTALARASFGAGVKSCPKEPTLWVLASRLEEADGKSIRARALLEKARLVNPANEHLWAESLGVKERSGGAAQTKAMLSRALQECPTSGVLWSMALWAEPRASRKTKSVDALRKTKDNPLVVCTVARILWADRAIERARDWFGRAMVTDPDLGDIWAWWLKFERQHGTEEHREVVRTKCVAADPHHSPVWQSVAKDVANVGKSTQEILEIVANLLQ
ncbi:unnamed protein product [Cyclocybe aegerita]|uniref:PRP1 splicing factor N-terminal domain-containing protein n=1 Tax=Cyclocybe aegerita TaxID=1973307 RepID=A0A8S0WZP3_CYCAE|nr:unnamed protein product [Cyclocybe aegerita]